ncbi:MAG: hypothetical protein ACI828_002205 [Flavobacteriales bacterium]|jgi:hypothetical protein
MAFLHEDFPMDIHISFEKLVNDYRVHLEGDDVLLKQRAERVIAITKRHPELIEGIDSPEQLAALQPQIDDLLVDLFSEILTNNEIKIAVLPFNESIIKATKRYSKIIADAGPGFEPQISNFNEDHTYIMGCSIILTSLGHKIDFRRPFFYDIPDAQGAMKYYRMLYNGDYISISPGPDAPEITKEDVAELIDNFDNIAMWKEKIPPGSWNFKGFVLANLYDATTDVSLSDFKTSLLKYDKSDSVFMRGFEHIFRSIFNLNEIHIGFSNYNSELERFERAPDRNVSSFILGENISSAYCKDALCEGSYQTVFLDKEFFAVSDVEKYSTLYPEIPFYKNLFDQKIQSVILAPIIDGEEFLGLLEIISPNKYDLNSINANKLLDVMPYLVDAILNARELAENELEVIIQNECTSIHPSVYWKFRTEAKRVVTAQSFGVTDVSFRDIVFKDVYPLFGQIDIKGSSDARNVAVKEDLLLQLSLAEKIITKGLAIENIPIYEENIFRIRTYIEGLKNLFMVDSERTILDFFNKDMHPLFDHMEKKDDGLRQLVLDYRSRLEADLGFIYEHRKAYDESVMAINKRMAAVLDKKQKSAQKMYPHFFERFKTDGVEHNMYIGESITREDSFNKIYLYNLRLWQLQVMCEMENEHYKLSRKLPHPLDVASMILVFNTSLSVRFRMDEKRFDVDGTYNARYEVVKKRVDKAFIKGTKERITQKGKITIVYSQKEDEHEYMRYIEFLQSKNYLGKSVEVLELQDLQAVTGLKALRIEVLYKKKEGEEKKYYTYEDLMEEISN